MIKVKTLDDSNSHSHASHVHEESDESERQNMDQDGMAQFTDGHQIIHNYLFEDDIPATILEVNSADYTEDTKSMSIAPGEGASSSRLSPFINKEGYFYKYP